MNRIRLGPLRRVDHSGVLIGADGTRRSGWPARVLANDVSTRIDRQPACEERSIARVQGQAFNLISINDIFESPLRSLSLRRLILHPHFHLYVKSDTVSAKSVSYFNTQTLRAS